jgi:EAL domain-containing protein (putative c-di-GMP-specific phosphodiesterase class I)
LDRKAFKQTISADRELGIKIWIVDLGVVYSLFVWIVDIGGM